MISCRVLEQPGMWRLPAIIGLLLIPLAPAFVLVFAAGGVDPAGLAEVFRSGFASALVRSIAVAGSVAALAVALGLPAGIVAGLYEFPLRRLLLAALALPLFIPSFLGAIGLSMLRTGLGLPNDSLLSGFTGTVLSFTLFALPLVTFVSLAAVGAVTRSQRDAARLAGGELHLMRRVVGNVLPVAVLTAVLASALTLSDPGPGQILGYSGAAAEILGSFASQYDFALAARQCLALAVIVLLITLPIILLLAPRFASGLLARDVTPAPLREGKAMKITGPLLLLTLVIATAILPLIGFAQPLLKSFPMERALQEAGRTIGSSFYYSLVGCLLATALGVLLAVMAGRSHRVVVITGLLLVFAMPPSLGALGFVYLGSFSPAELDPLLRSRFTVGVCLALRLVPITAIFAMRSFGASSPSWANAAALHGMPMNLYFRRILFPWMGRAILLAALLVALLALADITTVLLLHPPGNASLPLAIFTVMANAPEALVSALCLTYFAGAVILLLVGITVTTRRKTGQ